MKLRFLVKGVVCRVGGCLEEVDVVKVGQRNVFRHFQLEQVRHPLVHLFGHPCAFRLQMLGFEV